jgi:hypothetical protein
MSEPKVFTTFKNSYVHIVSKSLRSGQKMGKGNKVYGHIITEGFVTDFCHDYLYLSLEPMGEITEAIKFDEITKIYLPIQELSAILESQGNSEGMN